MPDNMKALIAFLATASAWWGGCMFLASDPMHIGAISIAAFVAVFGIGLWLNSRP